MEGFNRQQSALDALTRGMKNPMEGFNRQQSAIQKIISSLESPIKVQSFDFNGSLLAVNDVLADTLTDIETKEKSSSTQLEQELLTWSYEQIEIFYKFSNSLRNIYNAIDTKTAKVYIWELLSKISIIITIVNCIHGSNTGIHIHNNYEDVIIESEINGNKTDIYIDKKADQHKLKNDNERYSGGERT